MKMFYQKPLRPQEDAMERFIQKYDGKVTGMLSGFDRLAIRGTLRVLAATGGVMSFLNAVGVALADFGAYVGQVTSQLKDASEQLAYQLERPFRYLESSRTRKGVLAREIAHADGITDGLICVLSCVEPCMSYNIRKSGPKRWLERRFRKCLHLYHYWMDQQFGFMSARLQTWLPQRHDNCFPWIEDISQAQEMMNGLLALSWPTFLNTVTRRINPRHDQIFRRYPMDYYWSIHQSEWATDILFNESSDLAGVYPLLIRGGMSTFCSQDVMRYLDKKPHGNFQGRVITDCLQRAEGIRIKHRMNANSLKMYNKYANLLRVETTMSDPRDFKSFRSSTWDPHGPRAWRPLRKGIADLHRRAEVSQASNERYLDALASLDTDTQLNKLIEPVCRPVRWKTRRVRPLRPWSKEDATLLRTISRGEFTLNGFRNRDLGVHLFPGCCQTPQQKRRISARVTRKLQLLRAHRIIYKVPRTHRYVLTKRGREITTAILDSQDVTLAQLKRAAA
jgi:hypothetical protein